jgi:branched-chain amino acid transport system permease protein
MNSLLVQLINGLASGATLFLIALGLSLIFGVTRIVNFAHGSLYMLGIYTAYTITNSFGHSAFGFWGGVLCAALAVAVLGAVLEIIVLRRIYQAPELFQLLATFALALIMRDAALWLWGPEDLLGARAPHLSGSIELLGHSLPQYNLLLIFSAPLIWGALHLLLTRTRFGLLLRAAQQDREMLNALGVPVKPLFTGVFALGAFLAGLAGALQSPVEPANLNLDLSIIGDAFVVVVVGGLGSLSGAFWAALLVAEVKALCVWLGQIDIFGLSFSFSKLTLVVEFLIMAAVLSLRPWGLRGKPISPAHAPHNAFSSFQPSASKWPPLICVLALLCVPILSLWWPYSTVLAIDILIAILFAASLHFVMGPGGMHSFGHAAYFGVAAYAAALLLKNFQLPFVWIMLIAPLCAAAFALMFGWFAVRLSGVYLAMLTLAFAQIVWSIVFAWDDVTGGSNGLVGVWPPEFLSDKTAYYFFTALLVFAWVVLLRRALHAPFGFALRAVRDHAVRAQALGIAAPRVQWAGFTLAGLACGVAGTLFAFAKGSIAPETLAVARSIDGLVMVLLGGIHTLSGPIVGAALFTWLQDFAAREFAYWRAALGGIILILVWLFPQGVVGGALQLHKKYLARKT